jgi:predicted NAD/FAD-binding protein
VRIGVVGSGISGMAAAWLLSQKYEVDLFEADTVLGGHTHTVDLTVDGREIAVDTGFMVFNERTYPNLVRVFDHLGIDSQESDMSFSVRCGDDDLEWSSRNLIGVFSDPANLLKAEMWRMLYDMVRLSASADSLLADETVADLTLGELLDREGYSRAFVELFLIPMVAAIWSTPSGEMLDYPAATFLRFADNHGLLHITGKPVWRTVPGGARRYLDAMEREITGDVRTGAPVTSLRRVDGACELGLHDGSVRSYDAVVLGCHAPQALAILKDPSPDEGRILGSFAYQPNIAVLHSDADFLPRRRLARASWNYEAPSCDAETTELSVTYYLNRLQSLPVKTPVLLTLNPSRAPREELVYQTISFEHPMFDQAAVDAQGRLDDIQGVRNTWYCGAWQRYGFHEDGLLSAIRVAGRLGADPPWPLQAGAAVAPEGRSAIGPALPEGSAS